MVNVALLCETLVSSVLQEEHAEEQTDGHRPKEIQHGPQEGERAAVLVDRRRAGAVMVGALSGRCGCSSSGHLLPDGQFSPEEHQRGNRQVPLQGGGAEQDGDRRVPGGKVRKADDPPCHHIISRLRASLRISICERSSVSI